MLLLIDNYDSFTWNLRHAFARLGAEVEVVRNDALTVEEALALLGADARAGVGAAAGAAASPGAACNSLVFSPGPGRPAEAGICPALLAALPPDVPFLGVCLGFQALVEHCGGTLQRDPEPMHGKSSPVLHEGGGLYAGLPSPLELGRYHSLRAATPLPDTLRLDAWTADGTPMGAHHRERPWHGVQFHPESVLSPQGEALLGAFLRNRP